jgi:hypothetical protein
MKRLAIPILATSVVMGLAVQPTPTLAQDCVSCSFDSSFCESDPDSSACRCVIKNHDGFFLCFERDFLCALNGSCSSDPPPEVAKPTFPISVAALDKFDAKEPLLSLVLHGVVVFTPDKKAVLDLEPYARGTISGKLGHFTHRGFFTPRGNGQVAFQIEMEKEDGSTITYAGILGDRGQSITYSKSTKAVGTKHLEKVDWRAAS